MKIVILLLLSGIGLQAQSLNVTRLSNSVRLEWQSVTNTYYRLQTSTNLADWTTVYSAAGDARRQSWTNTTANGKAFFRTSSNPAPPGTNLFFYWGYSTNNSLTDDQVTGLLTGVVATSRLRPQTTYSPGDDATALLEYIYFSYPYSWGAATFYVGGLGFDTSWDFVTNTVNGLRYRTYRSYNILCGDYLIEIK